VSFENPRVEDFLALSDTRLGRLEKHLPRSGQRTARLVLQAMLREGMLQECDVSWEGDTLSLRRGDTVLSVRGCLAGHGDRFFLTSLELGLEDFLQRVRRLAGIEPTQAWARLEEELREAHLTQAVAYGVAGSRPEPRHYLDFEEWTPEGHNLHPGAKTRAGFSATDQLNYAPEMSSSVKLPWLAVSKTLLEPSGIVDPMFELDEESWALPVHPWQLEKVLPRVYGREIDSWLIRPLDREPVICRLCTSLRTVVPALESFPVLKTSVGCLMTSTDRSMSRYTVLQGPVYSEYLKRVFEKEASFGERVVALEETGGLCWRDGSDELRSRNLSLLFRQRPPQVADGVAVPCSTLPQPTWQNSDQTYFHTFFATAKGPLSNFQLYLELMIPFHLELYLRHGLALEAHLQNCVVVWTEAGPDRLWVRDWGGLRADAARLSDLAPDLLANLDERSVSLTHAAAAEKKLISCLYCNHITEVVAGVSQAFEIPEDALWSKVAGISARVFRNHGESHLTEQILTNDWPVKCLLKMRLGLGGSGDLYRMRPNPLRVHLNSKG
jgi:siderophore synthetase component